MGTVLIGGEEWDERDSDAYDKLCCHRCGSTEVRWRQQGGRWVLFSLQPGVEHRCPIIDGFEMVTE